MPVLMWILSVVGTAAMLWVGGSIIIHGLEELGFGWLGHHIHDWAYAVGHAVPAAWEGFAEWVAKATMDGVFGLAYGLLLIPLATKVVGPVIGAVSGKKAAH
jgi:predicted DNA repair protein MutK